MKKIQTANIGTKERIMSIHQDDEPWATSGGIVVDSVVSVDFEESVDIVNTVVSVDFVDNVETVVSVEFVVIVDVFDSVVVVDVVDSVVSIHISGPEQPVEQRWTWALTRVSVWWQIRSL